MPAFLTLLLAALLCLTGCATSTPAAPATPLPDAHDLSQNPLDVISLPQP